MLNLTAKDARLLKAASGRLAVWAKRMVKEHRDCCVVRDRTRNTLERFVYEYEDLIDTLYERKDTRWRVK